MHCNNFLVVCVTEQVGYTSSASDRYLEGNKFEHWQGHWLYCLSFL